MILVYHKVAPETPTYWWVSVDSFHQQMADLQSFDVVSLRDYDPKNPQHVVITFDGVYSNVRKYALPILERWGYPFELFVIGDYIGRDNAFDEGEPPCNFASLDELDALVRGGGRIQWHTRTHQRLASLATAEEELDVPQALRDHFPSPHLDWFAYPHGVHDATVVEAVRARFAGALSCDAGNDDDRYQLNRVIAHEGSRFARSTVSVIVANYNYGRFIGEAIESVLAQTIPPDDILVIDDASTDHSMEVIRRYQDRVRIVRNDSNLGIVKNFRKAVSLTRGDYIAFLGADNRMRSDYVERCRAALDRNRDAAVAYTDMLIFGPLSDILATQVGARLIAPCASEGWNVYAWTFPEPTPEALAGLNQRNFIHGSSMYRREDYDAVGGYLQSERPEDHHLFARMLQRDRRAVRVPHTLIEYRQHSAQQANTVLSLQLDLMHRRKREAVQDAQIDEMGRRIQSMHQEIEERNRHIQFLDRQIAWRDEQLLSRDEAILLRDKRIQSRDEEIQARDEQVRMLVGSKSWRITRPLRWADETCRRVVAAGGSRLGRLARLVPRRMKHTLRWVARMSGLTHSDVFGRHPSLRRWILFLRHLVPQPGVAKPGTLARLVADSMAVAKGPELDAFASSISLPFVEDPEVSVIVPTYNHVRMTLECLKALVAATGPLERYEVILVDDGSSAPETSAFEKVGNLKVLRNEGNLGFLRSCNAGVALARGRLLVLLNNDTIPLPGWLEGLTAAFRRVPEAGLVGSMLLYPDGRLQEAGCRVWKDGSGWNYGRGDDPEKPQYNFLCAADYCSGASIAVPKDLWMSLGGFDERYVPAYYEDTDLAFRVRELGRPVLYQPRSRIVHLEGATSGTDLRRGVKRHQVVNRERFVKRWSHVLREHPPAPAEAARWYNDRGLGSHVLFVDARTPMPDRDSGSMDAFYFLRALKELGFHVTFFATDDPRHKGSYTQALQDIGVECLYAPYSTNLEPWLERHGDRLAAVVLTRVEVARNHLPTVRARAPQAKVIFNTVDLHFLRLERAAELTGSEDDRRLARQTREKELHVIDDVDATILLSTYEANLVSRLRPEAALHIIPIIREISGRRVGFEERAGVAFIGGFEHPPNVDAMVHFVRDVWPLIRPRLPGVRFRIYGSSITPAVEALAGDTVDVVGYVPDIAEVFDHCRLSVAPLRYGAGQKGKIVSSLGYGVPVVCTSVAAEGMGLADGGTLVVADTADAFADAVVDLYDAEERWLTLSDEGVAAVRRGFDYAAGRAKIAGLFESLGLSGAAAGERRV